MAAVLGFAGCAGSGSTSSEPGATGVVTTAGLDRAIAAVNTSRRDLLQVPTPVVRVVMTLDDADAAAAKGEGSSAAAARVPVAGGLTASRQALAALPGELTDYRAALTRLSAAGTSLSSAMRQPLDDAVTAGRGEASALEAFGRTARTALKGYEGLDQAQQSWVMRSKAGWYRTGSEGADAYAVFVQPLQTGLDTSRRELAAADTARLAASQRSSDLLRAADTALEPLRQPG